MLVNMIDVLEVSGSEINPDMGPIIVGSIRLVFAGVAPLVIHKFAPKSFFVTCQILSALAMVLLGGYVFLQNDQPDLAYLNYFGWIPLAVVVFCSIMRSAGISPVLSILLSEVYPTDIRSVHVKKTIFSPSN